MWTILQSFIEFVTILLLLYILVFWLWYMWDLSSPTRDQTHTPCIGRRSLNHWTIREIPPLVQLLPRTKSLSSCWSLLSSQGVRAPPADLPNLFKWSFCVLIFYRSVNWSKVQWIRADCLILEGASKKEWKNTKYWVGVGKCLKVSLFSLTTSPCKKHKNTSAELPKQDLCPKCQIKRPWN